jgi:hypothetical protein
MKLLHLFSILLLTITGTSCQSLKTFAAKLSTPEAVQIEASLLNLGILKAKQKGKISPGDAVAICNGFAIITSPGSAVSKIVPLTDLISDAAVSHHLLTPGTGLLIKETTAIIVNPALEPAPLVLGTLGPVAPPVLIPSPDNVITPPPTAPPVMGPLP